MVSWLWIRRGKLLEDMALCSKFARQQEFSSSKTGQIGWRRCLDETRVMEDCLVEANI